MLLQLMFLLYCQTILASLHKPVYNTKDLEAIDRHFESFLRTYNKHYDETEKVQRFVNFIMNVKKINELNSLYEKTTFDLNKFTDWSEDELQSLRGLKISENGDVGACKEQGDPTNKEAPEAFDWRDHGAVSIVRNEMSCMSCWAFAATGLVESRYLQKKQELDLSEQQLVDCDEKSNGCSGGLVSLALTYLIQSGGQELEDDYIYADTINDCRFDRSKVAARVINCTNFNLSSEEALKELLFIEGPIAIGIASHNWYTYKKGIWEHCDNKVLDHSALLVGYGSENGTDFWVVKNSAGLFFGEEGYIRVKRGVNCNGIAGIGVHAPFPAATSATVA